MNKEKQIVNNASDNKQLSEVSQEIYSLYPHKYADDKNTCCEKIDKLLLSFSVEDIKTEIGKIIVGQEAHDKALVLELAGKLLVQDEVLEWTEVA